MPQLELTTQENAYRKVLEDINRLEKFTVKNIYPINLKRYHIIESKDNDNIMVMFKTEVFYNYGQKMKELGYPEEKGVGESINRDDMKLCAIHKVERIFRIDPRGNITVIPFELFNRKSKEWINKEGKTIKSLSIHQFKRFNPD